MAITLTQAQARQLWLHAQKLDVAAPFGAGPSATTAAVEHLGYVQIDTINVIERCHHHILFNRIPDYRREDLYHAQSLEKSIFEYWTHALSYVPTKDFRFFMSEMKAYRLDPGPWMKSVKKEDLQKVMRLIKNQGAISIRDINDDVLVEKDHEWASRKPSKRALQLGFYSGRLTISERIGMLKKYELTERHFDWAEKPKPATEKEILHYLLDRTLRSQSVVSLDSICHLWPSQKPAILKCIQARVNKGDLLPVSIAGIEKISFWMQPQDKQLLGELNPQGTHILSPFDPLIIQRKRLQMLFNYEHRFEAYIPKDKRIFGYFALPVLIDDSIVAVLDLKTERSEQALLVQKWSWLGKNKSSALKKKIEEALHAFEKFQLPQEVQDKRSKAMYTQDSQRSSL